jgi:hypothetical protein
MAIDKAQLKILIANDLGATIEDRLEGERKSQYELQGAAVALKQAAQKVPRDLIAKLEREQTEGTNVIKDGLEAHHVIGLIKLWLTKASDYLGHLADVEQQKAIIQGGRAAGLEDAMKIVQRMRDETVQRVQEIAAAADSDAPPPLVDRRSEAAAARAEHGSVAERRAAAEAGRKSEPPAQDIPAPTPPPPAPEPAQAPARPKRKRKKAS